MALVVSFLWLGLVAWLILRAVRQRGMLREVAPRPPDAEAPEIAVVVPARDEADNIGPCLASLLALGYPGDRLRIVVVDDGSTDATGDIVATVARGDARVTLVRAPRLPPGWNGKVNAIVAGVRALPASVPWLCFLDADMRCAPSLLASALHAASTGAIDCLMLAPRHRLGSFAERLMIPCGHYMLSFAQDLSRVQAEDSNEVVASGQFMLTRRAVYDAVGTYAAVHDARCEDFAFARLVKSRGHRVMMQDGTRVVATRMYTGWATLWPGIAKNLTTMLGGASATLAATLLALTLAWASLLLPTLDGLRCAHGSGQACVALAPALLGSAAIFGLHIAGSVYFGVPFWYGLLFPLGYMIGSVLALDSLRWRLTGICRWKGRIYR